MNRGYDTCISLRKTYTAVLKFLTSNNMVIAATTALPTIYVLGYMINNITSYTTIGYTSYLTGSGFSIFTILFIAWANAMFSIWKTMPNLLTVSIFIYKCIGHWALVSFLIILFYSSQYVASRITSYLASGFLPSVILLLFAADIMRTKRTKMYEALTSVDNIQIEIAV